MATKNKCYKVWQIKSVRKLTLLMPLPLNWLDKVSLIIYVVSLSVVLWSTSGRHGIYTCIVQHTVCLRHAITKIIKSQCDSLKQVLIGVGWGSFSWQRHELKHLVTLKMLTTFLLFTKFCCHCHNSYSCSWWLAYWSKSKFQNVPMENNLYMIMIDI